MFWAREGFYRELSWLSARIVEVQSKPSGFEKPTFIQYEWNTAFMDSQEALKEMMKTTGTSEEVR